MVRRAVTLGFALSASWADPLAAVGLGPVTQQSALGQSLRVVVPVTLSPGEDFAAECFRIAAGGDGDGIPQVSFGRVSFERTASGAQLVVTNARPVQDPVIRLTLRAGCETAVRREYVLLMDPPAIDTPLVAEEAAPRSDVAAEPAPPPPSLPVARPSRNARPPARDSAASPSASRGEPDATQPARKPAPPKARAAVRAAPKRPAAAGTPRLTVSSGGPTTAGAKSTPAEERAQRERADSIEAETLVLRQRIVELTAMIDRMQQEVRAAEEAAKAPASAEAGKAADEPAKVAAAEPAKSPPPAIALKSIPAEAASVWQSNWPFLAAIIGLPLVLAAGFLWRRRQDSDAVGEWPPAAPSMGGLGPIPEPSQASALSSSTAGMMNPAAPEIAPPPPPPRKSPRRAQPRERADALAVSELLHVTEEARVYIALGHPERAIDVLNKHIHELPRSVPAAWLMLLELYHSRGHRQEFRRLAEEFHLQCNVQAPLWEAFGGDETGDGGLETFPHILRQVVSVWRGPECREYLEGLLYDNREGRRIGFPLAAYGEILLLLQILDAPPPVDIDSDLVGHGKLDPAPRRAPSATGAHPGGESARPNSPERTTATGAPQRPIEFELDLGEAAQDRAKKPPT